jgi:hypothetical protein
MPTAIPPSREYVASALIGGALQKFNLDYELKVVIEPKALKMGQVI